MSRVLTQAVLILSGALLGLIGGALLVSPIAFLAMSHVAIDNDPGLLSELTAPSVILILTGALQILGAFRIRFANLALSAGAIVYGSYGLGRLMSMALHGMPSQSLIVAAVVELAVAAVLVALRLNAQRQRLFRPVL